MEIQTFFYEIAVADCAARPVILLNESSHVLPFDLKDMRVILYNYKPMPLLDNHYRDQLIEGVREALKSPKNNKVPFKKDLSPLGHYGNDFKIYDRYIDSRSSEGTDFVQLLDEAEEFFWGCGIGLDSWSKAPDFPELIDEKFACKKVAYPDVNDPQDNSATTELPQMDDLRILIMDENNTALPKMLRGERKDDLDGTHGEIARSTKFWENLSERCNRQIFRKATKGIIYQQIAMNEKQVIYTPYAYSVVTNESPTIQADRSTAIYKYLKNEFDVLWKDNSPDQSTGG